MAKVIQLAWHLEDYDHFKREDVKNRQRKLSELLEQWFFFGPPRTKEEQKTFVLGSDDLVHGHSNKGFFSTILAAYNSHMILKTCPEDWWFTISQKVAKTIDTHADHEDVRKFFVPHEGKKQLTVNVGPSIYGVNYDWFFNAMTEQITKNLNNPEYTDIMDMNFSQTKPVQKTVNNIMLMYSFQKYFDYTMCLLCGIPGVIMLGSEDDWKMMIEKHKKLEEFLKPVDHVLKLGDWFKSSRQVLINLLNTFQGNPDKDWWSKIVTQRSFGSGSTVYNGWFLNDFQGECRIIDTKNYKFYM